MNISSRAIAIAVAIGTFAACGASANPVTYTLEGDFTGNLDGTDFSSHLTFTALGDTDTFYDGGYYTSIHLTGLSEDAGGSVSAVLGDLGFFNNPGNGVAGFQIYGYADFLDFGSPAFWSYDPTTALAATDVTVDYLGGFYTDQGHVTLTSGSNLVFSASVGGAVPEPASWAMMLCGFGVIGSAMRTRRKAAVTFS